MSVESLRKLISSLSLLPREGKSFAVGKDLSLSCTISCSLVLSLVILHNMWKSRHNCTFLAKIKHRLSDNSGLSSRMTAILNLPMMRIDFTLKEPMAKNELPQTFNNEYPVWYQAKGCHDFFALLIISACLILLLNCHKNVQMLVLRLRCYRNIRSLLSWDRKSPYWTVLISRSINFTISISNIIIMTSASKNFLLCLKEVFAVVQLTKLLFVCLWNSRFRSRLHGQDKFLHGQKLARFHLAFTWDRRNWTNFGTSLVCKFGTW